MRNVCASQEDTLCGTVDVMPVFNVMVLFNNIISDLVICHDLTLSMLILLCTLPLGPLTLKLFVILS